MNLKSTEYQIQELMLQLKEKKQEKDRVEMEYAATLAEYQRLKSIHIKEINNIPTEPPS
jgi:hypothetical protein